MNSNESHARRLTLYLIVLGIFLTLAGRLFYLQVVDTRYVTLANGNVLRPIVIYPARGEVYDRNGAYLVKSRECYDLMVIYRNMDKTGFDTMLMCSILNIPKQKLIRQLKDAAFKSPRAPVLLSNFISIDDKLRFDEHHFRGFYMVSRTIREYPMQVGGNLLGYLSEISKARLDRDESGYYQAGDYIGTSGVELAYEPLLRGHKGTRIIEIDNHGTPKGSYMDGQFDTLPQAGRSLVSTIDIRLQKLGEELMEGKVGAAVAIEPATGEILMMVSSPTYDPDLMVGRERSNHYNEMGRNKRSPLFNRAVSAGYPPGSTFKLVQGLIGLEEGVLTPKNSYPCHKGFIPNGGKPACHGHLSPLDLRSAVANSCNAYFCYVFRNILDNKRYKNIQEAYDVWYDYVRSFGFGRKLDSDFLGEGNGMVYDHAYYDRLHRGRWSPFSVLSLSIGQGELGCTPLQMANLAAIVANRGYYYIPHIVKRIEGQDSLDRRFYERHYTKVSAKHFEPIVEGMWMGVNVAGTSVEARLPGLDVCGKTGTAQNPKGRDHSTFLSFAPKDNPRIAISVYVEHGGFGNAAALPIASLLEEFYLTDTIRRQDMLRQVKDMTIYYPVYDKKK